MQKLRDLSFFAMMCCLGSSSISAQDYSQATEAMREFIEESGDMRICRDGESPVILVEGKRVQVCRRQTLRDVENMFRLFQKVTPPQEDREVAASRRLCVALVGREDFSSAKEHCMKASKGGDSSSTLLLGVMAQRLDESESALEFYSLASDQGSEQASLLAGIMHAKNANWEKATGHLRRCYQPSVNGDSYNPKPYSPSSKTKFDCTNSVLKLVLAGKIPQEPFYDQTPVVPASIKSEIPFPEFRRFAGGYRRYPGNWDVFKDEGHLDISQIKGSDRVKFRIWMVKDVPLLCHLTDSDGDLIDGIIGKRMCRFFQTNYTYNPALSADGRPISSILEGSIEIEFPRTQ